MSPPPSNNDNINFTAKGKVPIGKLVAAFVALATIGGGGAAVNKIDSDNEANRRDIVHLRERQDRADADAKVRAERDDRRWEQMFKQVARVEALLERQTTRP